MQVLSLCQRLMVTCKRLIEGHADGHALPAEQSRQRHLPTSEPPTAPACIINRDESEHACALFTLFPLSEIIVRRSNVRKRFDLQNATDGTCTATLAPSSTLLC